jgi:S-DNA-T family DNA segregation ATPase FtsK/SpoIIIE
MEREKLLQQTGLALGAAAWVFLLLSLGSFHATDWPSHAVYPYPPVQNLCGHVGSLVAYWAFVTIGQGVFPILFFTGVLLTLAIFKNRVSDLWLRAIGLVLLAVSFAAIVHNLRPGSMQSLPEGYGGFIGIATSTFLQHHCNTVGARLILLTTMLVGLLLAADDLVLRAPGFVTNAIDTVRKNSPPMARFTFPPLPKLPTLKNFVTRDKLAVATLRPRPAKKAVVEDSEPQEPQKPASKVAEPSEDDQPKPAPTVAVRKDIVVRLPSMIKPRQVSPPQPPREIGEYPLPPWHLLADTEHGFAMQQEKVVREKAAVLEQALAEFNIDAHVVEIDTGPVITMYELRLAPGIKVSAITALSNDVARALSATSVRIVAPVPGKDTVGIEVPNAVKEKVRLKELMQLAPESKKVIPLFLGKDASGEPLIGDLVEMPHCLIAGTTGSGKSVCINSIIMSILYKQRPDVVKLILVDPKMVELAPFRDIPHLMCPVITEMGRATSVLDWACEKMDERYELLAEAGVRNIRDYNRLSREELMERFKPSTPEEEAKLPKTLPYIVIIVDELADLMLTNGREIETFIVRLAQKARAVGIHLILATQRPQATVVTGLIKSNMPCKIAFRVASRMDSRIVLDQNGAELLLGLGDMLFLPPGASKPTRGQGTYVDDREIRETVTMVRGLCEAQFEPDLVQIKGTIGPDGEMERDELFDDAVRVVLETRRGSVSLLQRRLTIGYSRASRLIEQMAQAGIVGDYKGSQAREATISLEDWNAMKEQEKTEAAEAAATQPEPAEA